MPARVLGVGYSHVNLDKDQGGTVGACKTRGAGAYWTDEIESPGLHDLNPAAAVDALGPFGLSLIGPTVSTSEHGNRPILNAPYLELTAGLAALEGRVGENTHTRLVNIDFEGLYGR